MTTTNNTPPASIAILGGGITGLTTAFYLARAGYRVTVLEAQPSIGGLSAAFHYGPFHWDKFYHCILTSDRSLRRLIEDLDLEESLRWTKTEVGFYSHDALHRMTRPADLLRFPHLSLLDKMRFALGTVYAARFAASDGLEAVPLQQWVRRIFGKTLHREIWEPLLRCKLGELREQASAAFLHATLKRLYSTRDKGPEKQEKLGYVAGGYRVVLERLHQKIHALGGSVQCGVRVERVSEEGRGVRVDSAQGAMRFDRAVITLPNPVVKAICPDLPPAYVARLDQVRYLGMLCVVLVLRRPLSEFYVTNITQQAAFTGIIEMTNLIGTESTEGHSLVYLPKYTAPDDPLFQLSDEEVWERFSRDLFRMHPTLRATDIAGRFVFRERSVQPLPSLHYSAVALPAMETPLPGIFLANTSQIVNDTLNNNAMTGIARTACKRVIESLDDGRSATRVQKQSPTEDILQTAEERFAHTADIPA